MLLLVEGLVLLVGMMILKQALDLPLGCHSQSQMKSQLLRGSPLQQCPKSVSSMAPYLALVHLLLEHVVESPQLPAF